MSLAYVILAHRNPDQLGRLLGRLLGRDDRAFVHIDRSVELGPFEAALRPLLSSGHVRLAHRRFRSRWAGYNLLAATLATVEQAIIEATFTHVSLISGDAYPLVPATALHRFFEGAEEQSFMFYSSGDDGIRPPAREGNRAWYWDGDVRRMTYRHYQVLGRRLHLPNRFVTVVPRLAPPKDLALFQGSQWWTLSRAAARHVVETFIRRPELHRFFRRTVAPDEFAVHMVLCNSRLGHTIVNDDLHFIEWAGWHPRHLTLHDLTSLSESTKLFARKVDGEAQPQLLDALDRVADGRETRLAQTVATLNRHYLGDV